MLTESPIEVLHQRFEAIFMHASVVLYGHDVILLSTRKQVLESAGMSVRVVRDAEELEHAVGDVLVLCHTLTPAEQMDAAERCRSRSPHMSILLIGEVAKNFAPNRCERLGAYPGPALFIEKVRHLASPSLPR